MVAKRRSLDEWTVVIEEMLASGVPQQKWCQDHGVNWTSVYSARKRLKKSAFDQTGNCPKFVQVNPEPALPGVTITCKGLSFSASAADMAVILTHLAGE